MTGRGGDDFTDGLAAAATERLGEALRDGTDLADELTGGVRAENWGSGPGEAWIELADGRVYAFTVRLVR